MKKEMLWVGSENGQSKSRLEVLSKLFRIFCIDEHPPNYQPGLSKNYLSIHERILRKFGIYLDKELINKTILIAIKYKKFDFIWIENEAAKFIKKRTLKILANKKIHCILYSSDNLEKFHNLSLNLLMSLKFYNTIIVTKFNNLKSKFLINFIKDKKKIFFVQKAFDIKLHKIINQNKKKYDVSFVGTYEKYRYKSLVYVANKLKKKNKKIIIYVWGNNWPKKNLNCPNLKIFSYPVYGIEYVKIMNSSFINLNFLRKINNDDTTDRTIEIPATGSFMLSEYSFQQNKIFENNKEVAYFKNNKQLYTKIIYFIKRPKLMKKISINGYKKTRSLKLDHKTIIKNVLKKSLII